MTTTTKARPSAKPAARKLTLAETVDQLGGIKAAIAALEKQEKALKDALIESGEAAILGELFQAAVTESVRWTLDTAAVKAEMGEDWVTARSKVSPVVTVRVSARS